MPPETIDFSQRIEPELLPEAMDQPCSYEEMRDCLRDLAQVNRLTLAYRPTLAWMERAVAAHGKHERPLHVVDVGCGAGDTLRQIERWAKRRGVKLRLTGIDLNPDAVRAAREFSPPGCSVEWIAGDVFSYAPDGNIDIVLNSLMTHHLSSTQIVEFVKWMEATARCGWFVNDLDRSERAYGMAGWLTRLMRWHRFVQHDALVSIRRAFRVPDWERYCAEAGVPRTAVEIQSTFPARLCVGRLK